jgi:hypothetical protein
VTTCRRGAKTGRVLPRPGQVAVVSPILVQAAFDCALSSTVGGPTSSRHSGLAPGETAVSPSPDGTSGAPPSPYRRAVSFLLRCSGSHPAGSHPPPWSPEWGLSSAGYRCRTPPPSAALCLLAGETNRPLSVSLAPVYGARYLPEPSRPRSCRTPRPRPPRDRSSEPGSRSPTAT